MKFMHIKHSHKTGGLNVRNKFPYITYRMGCCPVSNLDTFSWSFTFCYNCKYNDVVIVKEKIMRLNHQFLKVAAGS